MNVIGLCGSPREGNTEYYVRGVLGDLAELGHQTEFIKLNPLDIEQCQGCYGCIKRKKCVLEDDFDMVFQAMSQADCIVVGSPVYNGSITPRLKAVLDRAGFSARWVNNKMETKKGKYDWGQMVFSRKLFAPITVARKTGQTFALAQMALWASVNDMVLVGSNYWTVGTAGTSGLVNASEDEEGESIMRHLVENLDYLGAKLYGE